MYLSIHSYQKFGSTLENLLLFYHYLKGCILLFKLFCKFLFFYRAMGILNQTEVQRKFFKKSLSVCHWNLNSLSAHNFSKLTQLKAYILMYKHDLICLSETYLDSSAHDALLKIDGYYLVRADHPNNIKRGGVCIYYKDSLPVRVISLPYLKEALLLEMTYSNKKVIVSVICSPSQ